MTMRRIVFAMAAMTLGFSVTSSDTLAGLREQLDFETQVRRDAAEALHELDPHGYVQAKVEWNRISANLPGTATRVEGMVPMGARGELAENSVKRVTLDVFTNLKPVPSWLESDLRANLALQGIPLSLSFKELPTERVALIAKRDANRKPAQESADLGTASGTGAQLSGESGRWQLFGALAALAAALSAIVLVVGHRLARTRWREQSQSLEKTIGGALGASSTQPQASRQETHERKSEATTNLLSLAGQADTSIRELRPESLTALFADCYWGGQDGQAHFFWSNLGATQKSAVVERWNSLGLDERYFAHLRRVPPIATDAHQDAAYLSPLAVERLDSEALTTWARSNAGVLPLLSAMRSRALKFTLGERLALMKATNADQLRPTTPAVAPSSRSAARKLPPSIEIPDLSEADEQYLFDNPASVPADLRSSMRSLVWLALSPQPVRAAALARQDARGLAQAWTGPKVVLELLAADVPRDKRDLMEAYQKNSTPDRGSRAFNELCAAAAPEIPLEARTDSTRSAA
jgi:hypothetical protein